MDTLFHDMRHALRSWHRDFGFSATVVLTLAIGVGANTAAFGIVRSVLLEPLPYVAPDRLAMVWSRIPEQGITESPSGYANILDWKARTRAFDDLATFDPVTLTLSGGEWPEQISAARASANLFALLGVAPAFGRAFSPEEERQQAALAVISHDVWQRRFGGSTDVIGQTVQVAGSPLAVIGVMPEGFGFPGRAIELWVPQTWFGDWSAEVVRRGTDNWRVVGRLRDGVSIEEAREDLSGIAAQLEQSSAENAGLGVAVVPLHDQVTGGPFRLALWTLFGAVGLVLLIACANVAHLYVVRGMDRAQGFAVRVALGATAPRLIRHALAESIVLAGAATVGSLFVATAVVDLFIALAPADVPRLADIRLGPVALAYGIVLSLAAGVSCSVAPALRYARSAPYHALREGRLPTPNKERTRSVMIAGQFALAIVLVFGANLLIRSLIEARRVDPGFDPENVLMANLSVASSAERVAFYEEVLENVGAMSQVQSVGIVEDLFISGVPSRAITIEGRTPSAPETAEIRIDAIAGDFFEALGVPLVAGRAFARADGADAVPVAVVNEVMASLYWPGESAVGKRFRTGTAADAAWIEVVGVVGDMRRQGPERTPISQVFRPYVQEPSRNMVLLVRTEGPVPDLATILRTRVAEIDRTVPLYQVSPLPDAMERYFLQRRFQTLLLTVFSAVALILAAVGIYGLVQYSVAQRTREIGLRIALGAVSRQVVFMVLGQGVAVAFPGLVAGMLCALWLSESLSSLLFGVVAGDLLNVVVTAAVLLLTTLLACYVPARRAARVDPLSALHSR